MAASYNRNNSLMTDDDSMDPYPLQTIIRAPCLTLGGRMTYAYVN